MTIVLENGGEPLEQEDRITSFTENKIINFFELVKWLYGLRLELKRFGIIHRDINPSNILYSQETKQFKLIDFNWAEEISEPSGITAPNELNTPGYYQDDDKSIEKMMVLSIKKMSEDIASEGYKDGSSVNKGWFYQPVPFEEFSDIPVHKTSAIEEYKEVLLYSGITDWQEANVLEIGSANGYFSFNLAKNVKSIVGMEGDTFAYKIIEGIRLLKDIQNITFLNCYINENNIPEGIFDLTLCLNVHMWIYKQLGPSRTIEFMKKLSQKTKRLFFQTAGIDGSAMYNIVEFQSPEDIIKYLFHCGFNNVWFIRTTHSHGGNRHLFYAEGNI
jgi:hypothetical protein